MEEIIFPITVLNKIKFYIEHVLEEYRYQSVMDQIGGLLDLLHQNYEQIYDEIITKVKEHELNYYFTNFVR